MNEKTEERPESRTQTAGTENKERKRTDPQRQAQKRTAVAALLMLIPFCAFMYLIFGDTDAGEEPGTGGINTTIPDGKVQRIEASRQKAAEKVEAEALAGEKIQSLGEAVSLPEPDSALRITTSLPAGGIDRSQDAHREMARQIESFYSDPAPDPHTADLERELERLRGELTAKEAAESLARPDPMELVERQYALATKYFETPEKARTEMPAARGDRVPVTKVRRPPSRIVSTLARPSEDSAAAAENTPPRNSGFHTPVGASDALPANAIRACIAEDQTVNGNARLKLRLLEPLMAGETEVPENTVLYAAGRIDGRRLSVVVTSIEYGGSIIPVALTAYDTDGQAGLYIPNTAERTALKEGAANIGAGLGTSISFARSAGQQVAMDVVRGVMSGGSQYLASKMREAKVSVKAGYGVLLISEQ